nr:hypothetical protein [uncultured organism]
MYVTYVQDKYLGILKNALVFFFRAKQIKQKAEKEKKKEKGQSPLTCNPTQGGGPAQGQGRLPPRARQAGSSPAATACAPGSCLAAPSPLSGAVDAPGSLLFLFPLSLDLSPLASPFSPPHPRGVVAAVHTPAWPTTSSRPAVLSRSSAVVVHAISSPHSKPRSFNNDARDLCLLHGRRHAVVEFEATAAPPPLLSAPARSG